MNNVQQFSQVIPDLTDAETLWLMNYVEYRARGLYLDGSEREHEDVYPDFGFKIMKSTEWGTYAWFFSDECGDISQVAETVQDFIKAQRPETCFTMTWADYADKLRVGEFDGGGLFVSADQITTFHAVEWAEQQEKEFKARRANNAA